MTQQTERDALRKLAEAATPGPWAFGTFHRLLVVQVDKHGYADKHSAIADIGAGSIPWDATAESMQEYNDAEYIAAANPAAVITLLDQLQSQAERIKELIDSVNFKHSKITELENEHDTLRAELANAAIQHYIEQQAKELPVLPQGYGSIPWAYRGNVFIESQLKAYGAACAAHAREMAMSESVEQVTTLYEGDEAPYLIDICKAIEALKGK